MKRVLALAAGAAAIIVAVSTANAAECINGYMTLGHQVIVPCDEGAGAMAPEAGAVPAESVPEATAVAPPAPEPETTGSISAAPSEADEDLTGTVENPETAGSISSSPATPEEPRALMAESREECQPGQYWILQQDDASTPIACR
jgi:hypothetical protein